MSVRYAYRWLNVALYSLVLFSAVAGKWSGTVDIHDEGSGTDISTPVDLQINEPQKGLLTGTIGREGDADQVQIQNGKVEGNTVSFEAVSPEVSGPVRFHLTLEGDQLTGRMKGSTDSLDIDAGVKLSRHR